ncbi:MAG: hypothetical protein KDA24_18780 [Deltaproteobacteria bacterium]|nr:hypothetical protein [Deltaproteobacteria bacterium]
MNRLTVITPLVLALTLVGCDVNSGALESDSPTLAGDDSFDGGQVVWTPGVGNEGQLTNDASYVVSPESLAVFVGEDLSVEVELLEPDAFSLRAGLMPENAIFTELPAGALVQWQPTADDVGTHDFMMLVVDAGEPNLVIAQEMFVVDVLPRFRFIEYGF